VETELQQLTTLKANFEDLEKRNLLLTLTEKKPKWKRCRN
jgi:exonuclease SbcC